MLINNKLRYNLFLVLTTTTIICNAQTDKEEEQSVVTIIGNPVNSNNSNQSQEYSQKYINTVNYQTQVAPPVNGKLSNEPQIIEPTLENGMHMRFPIESPMSSSDRLGASGYASISGGSYGTTKLRKSNGKSITKHTFNIKKRFKCWFPKRKKKYRPNLCVDF